MTAIMTPQAAAVELAQRRPDNKRLKEKAEVLRKASAFFREREDEDMRTKFAFIAAPMSERVIRFIRRIMGVTRSCCYARQRMVPGRAEHAAWHDNLGAEIEALCFLSKRHCSA